MRDNNSLSTKRWQAFHLPPPPAESHFKDFKPTAWVDKRSQLRKTTQFMIACHPFSPFILHPLQWSSIKQAGVTSHFLCVGFKWVLMVTTLNHCVIIDADSQRRSQAPWEEMCLVPSDQTWAGLFLHLLHECYTFDLWLSYFNYLSWNVQHLLALLNHPCSPPDWLSWPPTTPSRTYPPSPHRIQNCTQTPQEAAALMNRLLCLQNTWHPPIQKKRKKGPLILDRYWAKIIHPPFPNAT